jgi:hypothetical protein
MCPAHCQRRTADALPGAYRLVHISSVVSVRNAHPSGG